MANNKRRQLAQRQRKLTEQRRLADHRAALAALTNATNAAVRYCKAHYGLTDIAASALVTELLVDFVAGVGLTDSSAIKAARSSDSGDADAPTATTNNPDVFVQGFNKGAWMPTVTESAELESPELSEHEPRP